MENLWSVGLRKIVFWTQGYLLSEREYSDFILPLRFLQVGRKVASSGIALRAVLGETGKRFYPRTVRDTLFT